MTTTENATLVIGRGELYFDRFLPGTLTGEGELYFGNTPGFSLSRTVEEIARFTSYGGQQIEVGGLVTREVHSADITTDNLSMANLALWFGSEEDKTGQLAIGTITESFTVKRGRWYQLGNSQHPFGVRHVEPDIVFKKGVTPVSLTGNIVLNLEEGRFFVLMGAPAIFDGDTLSVDFQWRQSQTTETSTDSPELVGALRYISKNPIGPRHSYFFPYVRIAPTGQIDLKGDTWQELSFEVDIRKISPTAEYFYTIELAPAGYTDDEQAIIDFGPISLEVFPYWDDQLDIIINTDIPAADYGAPL
ncbi:hypothetical protein [Rhizobium phage RHph_X2_30]|nr:hypothetical protein [Rhizobium phage RHph_X2_30]